MTDEDTPFFCPERQQAKGVFHPSVTTRLRACLHEPMVVRLVHEYCMGFRYRKRFRCVPSMMRDMDILGRHILVAISYYGRLSTFDLRDDREDFARPLVTFPLRGLHYRQVQGDYKHAENRRALHIEIWAAHPILFHLDRRDLQVMNPSGADAGLRMQVSDDGEYMYRQREALRVDYRRGTTHPCPGLAAGVSKKVNYWFGGGAGSLGLILSQVHPSSSDEYH